MTEFDILLKDLETILEENTFCEDNRIYIKSKLKYDIYNLVTKVDNKFIKDLEKGLECNNE